MCLTAVQFEEGKLIERERCTQNYRQVTTEHHQHEWIDHRTYRHCLNQLSILMVSAGHRHYQRWSIRCDPGKGLLRPAQHHPAQSLLQLSTRYS